MSAQTIVHGRIQLKGDFEASRRYLQTLDKDDKYPWIRTEMFSLAAIERPYYYEEPIVGFAASYKDLEHDWTAFMIKFEYLLRNIEFDTVKLQLETEYQGTYHFFWRFKSGQDPAFAPREQLIEMENWYFGYGYRCRWGLLDEPFQAHHVFDFKFKYPIVLDRELLDQFLPHLRKMAVGEKQYLQDLLENSDSLSAILTHYQVHQIIDYGFEGSNGYWIEKLKP